MRGYILIALATCTVLCVDVSGQIAASPTPVPLRVRVRGVDPYEMPGVIRVEAGRIASAAAVTIDGNTVRMASDGTTEPLAAYSPFTTCPLPPPENQLPIAVEAGERR